MSRVATRSSWREDPRGYGLPSTHTGFLHSRCLPNAAWQCAALCVGMGNGFGVVACWDGPRIDIHLKNASLRWAMCSVQPHGNPSSCTCPGAVMDVPMKEYFLLQSQDNPFFFPWLISQVMLPCPRSSPGSHSPLFPQAFSTVVTVLTMASRGLIGEIGTVGSDGHIVLQWGHWS